MIPASVCRKLAVFFSQTPPAGKIANLSGRLSISRREKKRDLCIVKNKTIHSVKTVFATEMDLLVGMTASSQDRSQTKNEPNIKAIELNAAEFRKQIYDYEKNPTAWKYEGDLPAVIDFYATWCGPCKMMAPVMETLAGEYEGRVRIYKIDVDKEQRLAALFGVRSIPTFLFIPQSGDPQHAMGAMDITQMRRIIDEVLLKK